MDESNKTLKALGFELLMDFIAALILILAYKYTFDTFDTDTIDSKMSFIRNAFVYIAPGSVEGFRIIVSLSKENETWDKTEVCLSLLCIIISAVLTLQCIMGYEGFACVYLILIMVYPARIISNFVFGVLALLKERRIKK